MKNNINGWHVILSHIIDNQMVPSNNNPKKSGFYLCTCVRKRENIVYRYLRIKKYNVDTNNWSDLDNSYANSDTILAWKDEPPCDFNDFEYFLGYVIEK